MGEYLSYTMTVEGGSMTTQHGAAYTCQHCGAEYRAMSGEAKMLAAILGPTCPGCDKKAARMIADRKAAA